MNNMVVQLLSCTNKLTCPQERPKGLAPGICRPGPMWRQDVNSEDVPGVFLLVGTPEDAPEDRLDAPEGRIAKLLLCDGSNFPQGSRSTIPNWQEFRSPAREEQRKHYKIVSSAQTCLNSDSPYPCIWLLAPTIPSFYVNFMIFDMLPK